VLVAAEAAVNMSANHKLRPDPPRGTCGTFPGSNRFRGTSRCVLLEARWHRRRRTPSCRRRMERPRRTVPHNQQRSGSPSHVTGPRPVSHRRRQHVRQLLQGLGKTSQTQRIATILLCSMIPNAGWPRRWSY
jgi:hypothetical protein